MKAKKIYFDNLDALRFLCFLSVFLYHSFHSNDSSVLNSNAIVFLKSVFANGLIGVNFFFVLSGFLITYLLLKEREETGTINIKKFYIRRILRIWPLYFFCVAFGFLVFPMIKEFFGETSSESANAWAYLLLVNNFDFIYNGLPDSSSLGVLWSLAIEEQFYLVWPLCLFLVKPKYYQHLMLFVVLLSLAFRFMYPFDDFYHFHTLSCVGDMAVGGLGALLFKEREGFRVFITHLKRHQVLIIYLLFALAYLFRDRMWFDEYAKPFERLLTACIILLLILEQAFTKNSLFKLGKIKVFSRLGIISFGLYSLHMIGILITIKISEQIGTYHSIWAVVFLETTVAFALTVIIAKISFRYYESPFLKLKDKYKVVE